MRIDRRRRKKRAVSALAVVAEAGLRGPLRPKPGRLGLMEHRRRCRPNQGGPFRFEGGRIVLDQRADIPAVGGCQLAANSLMRPRQENGDGACSHSHSTGWTAGEYLAQLPSTSAPDGARWTWEQCAAVCAAHDPCEFWTLQLHDDQKCMLLRNPREYHEGTGHVEGWTDADCLAGYVEDADYLQTRGGEEVWPKPEGWDAFTWHEMRAHFNCAEYANDERQTRDVPTIEDWILFRETYRRVVDFTAAFDDPVPPTEGHTFPDGGRPPYRAGISKEGRGRGLFASRSIRQGELIHDGGEVMFPDGDAWRQYVFALPRNRACDQIDWTWTRRRPDGTLGVFTAMNVSVLANGGSEGSANANPEGPTAVRAVAVRDIAEGEELVTDYDVYETNWAEVGL
ncbi:hypothetical protein ACHAXT_012009 [Thalassiosira profunda]